MRWAVLLALLGLAAGSPLCAEPSAGHAMIERCAHQAEASLRGLDALSRPCPGIDAAVRELGLDPLLPADWRTTASARALADLAALADRYAAPAPGLRLDGTRLKVIANALEPPPAPPPSWWERFKAWIRDWLEPKTEGASSWLRFLPNWHLSPRLARLLLEALGALIVIGTGALVVYELRASGLIGGGRYRRSRHASPEARLTGDRSLDFDALDSAVPHERAALLLRLLVRALTRSRRLGHDRDLTCRELIARARFDSSRQREQFENVALLAERALYGDPALAPPAISEEMLTAARALYAELLAAPRLQSAAS